MPVLGAIHVLHRGVDGDVEVLLRRSDLLILLEDRELMEEERDVLLDGTYLVVVVVIDSGAARDELPLLLFGADEMPIIVIHAVCIPDEIDRETLDLRDLLTTDGNLPIITPRNRGFLQLDAVRTVDGLNEGL